MRPTEEPKIVHEKTVVPRDSGNGGGSTLHHFKFHQVANGLEEEGRHGRPGVK